jgi:hypothetical protein
MGSGFGIAALIVLFLSLGIPIYGNFITLIALFLVIFSALGGNKIWPIAIVAAGAVKLFFLSPSWMIAMSQEGAYALWTLAFLAAPIAAMLFNSAKGARASPTDSEQGRGREQPPPLQAPSVEADVADWDRIADKDSPDLLQEYLLRHPSGRFAELARMKLERMGIAALSPHQASGRTPS